MVAGGVLSDVALRVCDQDFDATLDGSVWTVRWKWKADGLLVLKNQIGEYKISNCDGECFDLEVEKWVNEGWLEPYHSTVHGHVGGLVPMMAAAQPNKPTKIRPVIDYRGLNRYVSSHLGVDVAVCSEKNCVLEKNR